MKRQPTQPSSQQPFAQLALWALLAFAWFVMSLAASSRMYFLTTYQIGKMVEPFWEPFAATNLVVAVCFGIAAAWWSGLWLNYQAGCRSQSRTLVYFAFSIIPLVFWLARVATVEPWPAQFWEVIWSAAWTGMSFGDLVRNWTNHHSKFAQTKLPRNNWIEVAALACLTALAAGWWFSQSVDYYQNFLLGYNDFGHFLQRVANTAAGRGMLRESPVLPMFWDHFNPGLLLLVPLWKLYPSVNLVFALQAGSLAICSLVVYAISRRLGHSKAAAMAFGIAWLVQPSVGQMNLAYTYGWHPITFAIPLLLVAMLCLLVKRRFAALACTLLALSMEEGVFVIVAVTAAVCAVMPFVERWWFKRDTSEKANKPSSLIESLPTATWASVSIASALGFVLVYKFSGLAEFQTGRFVALGNSPTEILFSPVLRPAAFWGQVLRLENLLFILLLWLPCGLPGLLRGWRYLLPTLLPLGVLIVWDHAPAHNLAFQYPSTLLPLFWLATLFGASSIGASPGAGFDNSVPHSHIGLPSAVTALVTGLVLSLFVGQMPFSSLTLRDVEAMTYGAESELRRKSDGEDGRWLTEQVKKIQDSGGECLATARIAAHMVGNRDIETVGQYLERRERLAALPDRKGNPIKHYQWIILDRNDLGKWSGADTAQVEAEAVSNNFELVAEQFNIGVYKRRE
ncbi:MAG: DUF2079 domain-containing protein [Pirellulaceae bacterium]|nr:DUF2079 domain-containing protein [Pirellulaceae bacterium]